MELPLYLLDALASQPEQIRYMIGGTKDQYLVPDDVLNDAHHFCERAQLPDNWSRLSDCHKQAVTDFERALREKGSCVDRYPHAQIATLVNDDPDWNELRERAGALIRLMSDLPQARL